MENQLLKPRKCDEHFCKHGIKNFKYDKGEKFIGVPVYLESWSP